MHSFSGTAADRQIQAFADRAIYDDDAFFARNFALERRLGSTRVAEYLSATAPPHAELPEWKAAHRTYVAARVGQYDIPGPTDLTNMEDEFVALVEY